MDKPNDNQKGKSFSVTDSEYQSLLNAIKEDIGTSRTRAVMAANRELINLYWRIGERIVTRQERLGWGRSVVEQLSRDLRKQYPGFHGYSTQNLWYMRRFFLEYRDMPNLQQLVGEIPWGQNIVIFTRVSTPQEKEFYLRLTAEQGWSRNVLINQIKVDAFGRSAGKKLHNFKKALPAHRAEQVENAIKDVYMLDFLDIAEPVHEREMESKMVARIRDLLMEMGQGFTFVGSQYKISSPSREYFIDLLFFNRKINCLVAVELKSGRFEAEYVAKMGLYLSLLNDTVREKHENHPIGLILCAERDHVEVEYALKNSRKPMGVSEYDLTNSVPASLREYLPDAEELSARVKMEMAQKTMKRKTKDRGPR